MSCCGSASRVVLVSSQSCNFRKLALPLAMFLLSGVRVPLLGLTRGLQLSCVLTCSSQRGKDLFLEMLGFAYTLPHLHIRFRLLLQKGLSGPRKVWLQSLIKMCPVLSSRALRPGLPSQVSTPSSPQSRSLCCLGIPVHADW